MKLIGFVCLRWKHRLIDAISQCVLQHSIVLKPPTASCHHLHRMSTSSTYTLYHCTSSKALNTFSCLCTQTFSMTNKNCQCSASDHGGHQKARSMPLVQQQKKAQWLKVLREWRGTNSCWCRRLAMSEYSTVGFNVPLDKLGTILRVTWPYQQCQHLWDQSRDIHHVLRTLCCRHWYAVARVCIAPTVERRTSTDQSAVDMKPSFS